VRFLDYHPGLFGRFIRRERSFAPAVDLKAEFPDLRSLAANWSDGFRQKLVKALFLFALFNEGLEFSTQPELLVLACAPGSKRGEDRFRALSYPQGDHVRLPVRPATLVLHGHCGSLS
jgi:hypothetical protein